MILIPASNPIGWIQIHLLPPRSRIPSDADSIGFFALHFFNKEILVDPSAGFSFRLWIPTFLHVGHSGRAFRLRSFLDSQGGA